MRYPGCFVCSCVIVMMITLHQGSCNQMDPHVFPTKGSYFEGWYMRVIDFGKGASLGWIFNRIQPKNNNQNFTVQATCQNHSTNSLLSNQSVSTSYPCPIMVTHLVSSSSTSKLIESHILLPGDSYTLTKNGQPINSNPTDEPPAKFEAKLGDNINFIVRPQGTTFSISVGESTFRGQTASPVPWGPDGQGPESWIEHLPLPLHWFVYSLRSDVTHYEYINHKTGQYIRGGSKHGKPVVAHMEKNWGGAFPKAWIWAEGVNPANNVSFACSSGILHELFLDIKAELSGYKNPNKGIDCKFHPLNSIHVLEQDGCQGHARLKAEGPECTVLFDISVDPSLLSACLITPQVTGYELGCVESYNAIANITVFQRHGIAMVQTDSQIIKMAALEFGGTFMCNGKCPE